MWKINFAIQSIIKRILFFVEIFYVKEVRVNGLTVAERMKNFLQCLIVFVCKGHEFFDKSTLFYYKIVPALFLFNEIQLWVASMLCRRLKLGRPAKTNADRILLNTHCETKQKKWRRKTLIEIIKTISQNKFKNHDSVESQELIKEDRRKGQKKEWFSWFEKNLSCRAS